MITVEGYCVLGLRMDRKGIVGSGKTVNNQILPCTWVGLLFSFPLAVINT